MLRYVIVFLVLALIAAFFGFGGAGDYSWPAARNFSYVFLALAGLTIALAVPPAIALPVALTVALPVALPVAAAHLEIGRRRRARLAVLLALALRIHDAKIMLGVLVQVFRRDAVAARLRLARHRDIALEHLICVAAYLDARAVALEGLGAVRRARSPGAAVVMLMRHAAVTAARSILLSWPHDTCLIAIKHRDPGSNGSAAA